MATARDLIERSLRLIHVLDPGESPTAAEADDSLTALNDMLEIMSLPGLYIYTTREDNVSWTASQQSRTIGSSGNFNITRPTRIEDGTYFKVSSTDYPLTIIRSQAEYAAIPDKTTSTSHPSHLYYEPTYPLGVLYLWPVPSATLSVYLRSQEQMDSFATLDTSISYPPGYKELMVTSLCQRLAPEFGVAIPPEVSDMARRARMIIKRSNEKSVQSVIEIAGRGSYSVYSDS